jgi:imidazolonepropionase-like amidohydrolase
MRVSFLVPLVLGSVLCASAAGPALAQGPIHTPRVHALTGARIVQAPGRVIEHGTVVIRDGVIEAVGASVPVPADARIWAMDSLTVYPGLIDLDFPVSPPEETPDGKEKPESLESDLSVVHPERSIADALALSEQDRAARRSQGFTTVRALPDRGVFRGEAALLNLGDGELSRNVLVRDAGQVIGFATAGHNKYPDSIMGATAVIRQSLYDARWYQTAHAVYAADPRGKERPETNAALAALVPAATGKAPVLFVTRNVLDLLRARDVAREFGLTFEYVGSGEEYRRLDDVRAMKPSLVVPVNFPGAPDVDTPESALQTSLATLRAWDMAPSNPARLHDAGVDFAWTAAGLENVGSFRRNVALAVARGLPEETALAAATVIPARMAGVADRLGTIEAGKIADLAVTDGDLFADSTRVRSVWVDGTRYEVKAPEHERAPVTAGPEASEEAAAAAGDPEAWHAAVPEQPAAVLFRNADHVWTCGPRGILEHADVLVKKGKIAAVGTDLDAPGGAVVVDAAGKDVTPGIIDPHSHAAITGGVNESSHNVTAEVRIGDVVNPESINIYRQLAGGVTTINLLHGSANAIGGQNQVIKLRWGADPDGLEFEGAKPSVKFALGENPKESNWGPVEKKRYPQTRSGVEELIRQRFLAARDYMKERERWEKGGRKGIPPRRDLQLDAIAEVLREDRIIHCHSYRADEILMMIRLADEFGVKIATFDHVLEGYKVADEIAAHGAGGTCFSDWWTYQYEVIDAIPHDAAIMWDRGVNVSFNSDYPELARRLNLEAAKAVKYGGVPQEEALKFVTLHPAEQLRIQDRVGSLEPGKDADIAVWSGDPLSTYARCEETWVDGRKYFDRTADLAGRKVLEAERETLIEKAREARKHGKGETAGRHGEAGR